MGSNDFYAALKHRLAAAEWSPGQQLPSVRQLVAQTRASYHAVASSCAKLVSEGVLTARAGKGYFVAGTAQAFAEPSEPPGMHADPLFRLLQSGPGAIKLGCGWLPPAWRDTELLTKAIRRTARLEQSSLAEYGDILGYYPLRRQLCIHLKRHTRLDIAPRQIVTTLGATQGLDLVARLLIKPGDHVLVDEPCNGNLIRLIELAGGQVAGIPRTESGPDVAELQRYLAHHKVKAFFCNSTFHNPTGGNLSPRTAFQVLQLAIQHDFYIVEDDVYGDFSPGPRQTFAELDELCRVIYIGSFSKCLSASLRVGFVACSAELIEPLARIKLFTCVAVPAFCERFVNTILVDGTYAGHMKDVRLKLMEHQQLTQTALTARGWRFDLTPESGMFVWACHPDLPTLDAFISRLEGQGILLLPGSAFAVKRDYQRFLRVNCTHFSKGLETHFVV